MATSQNGYPANDRSVVVSYAIPGGKVALRRGAAGELLAEAAKRWHNEVEPLVWPGCWGYAERLIRGSSTTLSNHASGTAIDLNAPKHPLGTDPHRNFTPAALAALRRIVDESDGCIRAGAFYTGRADGMHLEAMKGEAACAAVLAKWRSRPSITPFAIPEDEMPLTDADLAKIRDIVWQAPLDDTVTGKRVQAWQMFRDLQGRIADLQKQVKALEAQVKA